MPITFTAVNATFSNGMNERLNQTLVNKTRRKINEKKNQLPWTNIAYQCTEKYSENEYTIAGFAPQYLLKGENADILPAEIKKEKKTFFGKYHKITQLCQKQNKV